MRNLNDEHNDEEKKLIVKSFKSFTKQRGVYDEIIEDTYYSIDIDLISINDINPSMYKKNCDKTMKEGYYLGKITYFYDLDGKTTSVKIPYAESIIDYEEKMQDDFHSGYRQLDDINCDDEKSYYLVCMLCMIYDIDIKMLLKNADLFCLEYEKSSIESQLSKIDSNITKYSEMQRQISYKLAEEEQKRESLLERIRDVNKNLAFRKNNKKENQ